MGSPWYYVDRYSDDVQERTVIKETSQTVWWLDKDWQNKPMQRQERKGGDWFPTKAEAFAEKKIRLERALQHADDHRSRAVQKLKDFNLKYAGTDGKP